MGWALSCETGFSEVPISFCYGEGNIISRGMAMCGMDLAQSEICGGGSGVDTGVAGMFW